MRPASTSAAMAARRQACLWLTVLALPASPAALAAQTTPPAVSGIIFGNYQYLVGGPRKDFNQFVLDRAYLTVRGTPAERTSVRLTSDVYQSGDGNGWSVRMKYAYLDYGLRSRGPWATTLRAGMLQTVVIEHQERFWPRWLGSVPVDRHGYLSSADVGIAAEIALPERFGQVYAHVVNGPSYARREADRFKDVGLRVSLTPLAGRTEGLLATATLTGWIYEGARASRFVADPLAPIGAGLARDRWGLFAGIRDPRLTVAAEYARASDASETGDNTLASPRAVVNTDGIVRSAFAIVRPTAWTNDERRAPLGILARYDHVRPDDRAGGELHYALAGALYDVNARLALSLNYQEQLGAAAAAPQSFRGWFLNAAVSF